MPSVPEPIHDAAAAFDTLPGVGPRAALRYAYWLVSQPRDVIERFARSVAKLKDGLARCERCGMWSERSPCKICADSSRNNGQMCVVATSQDAQTIEDTGAFRGVYHVLRGLIDPLEDRHPDTLAIPELVSRIAQERTTEIVLALDSTIQGDTTALYLRQQLQSSNVKMTRLARGLPTGSALEYTDPRTLADALRDRKE